MSFNAKNYPLLSKFYDVHLGIISVPGPIYHDSEDVQKEVLTLILEEPSLLSDGTYVNWAIEAGDIEVIGNNWENYYEFTLNKELLKDTENCIAPDWGGHLYSKIIVYIRKVPSFV